MMTLDVFNGKFCIRDGCDEGRGPYIKPLGMRVTQAAQSGLRDALGIQPDPAAEARATLEQARADDVIYWWCLYSPCPTQDTYRVELSMKPAPLGFDGATEAEAIAAAAAHVEELRKPKLPEPETMLVGQCVKELSERGHELTLQSGGLRWHKGNIATAWQEPNETLIKFHQRSVSEARKLMQHSGGC